MSLRIVTVPASGDPALVSIARTLVGEYAAMPHIGSRWASNATDIAALPLPYVAPRGRLLVAIDESEPLGTGSLLTFDAPTTGEIKRLYVREAARGRGVGDALMRALLDEARRMRFSRVILDTAPELTAARAMYTRFGFRQIPHYRPEQLSDDPCYELCLPHDTQ
jgi:GNAT superfamily N-acetyltransferase